MLPPHEARSPSASASTPEAEREISPWWSRWPVSGAATGRDAASWRGCRRPPSSTTGAGRCRRGRASRICCPAHPDARQARFVAEEIHGIDGGREAHAARFGLRPVTESVTPGPAAPQPHPPGRWVLRRAQYVGVGRTLAAVTVPVDAVREVQAGGAAEQLRVSRFIRCSLDDPSSLASSSLTSPARRLLLP